MRFQYQIVALALLCYAQVMGAMGKSRAKSKPYVPHVDRVIDSIDSRLMSLTDPTMSMRDRVRQIVQLNIRSDRSMPVDEMADLAYAGVFNVFRNKRIPAQQVIDGLVYARRIMDRDEYFPPNLVGNIMTGMHCNIATDDEAQVGELLKTCAKANDFDFIDSMLSAGFKFASEHGGHFEVEACYAILRKMNQNWKRANGGANAPARQPSLLDVDLYKAGCSAERVLSILDIVEDGRNMRSAIMKRWKSSAGRAQLMDALMTFMYPKLLHELTKLSIEQKNFALLTEYRNHLDNYGKYTVIPWQQAMEELVTEGQSKFIDRALLTVIRELTPNARLPAVYEQMAEQNKFAIGKAMRSLSKGLFKRAAGMTKSKQIVPTNRALSLEEEEEANRLTAMPLGVKIKPGVKQKKIQLVDREISDDAGQFDLPRKDTMILVSDGLKLNQDDSGKSMMRPQQQRRSPQTPSTDLNLSDRSENQSRLKVNGTSLDEQIREEEVLSSTASSSSDNSDD